MMNVRIVIILSVAIVLASCVGNELAEKKEALKEAKAEQSEINNKIKELEGIIAILDTSKVKVEKGTAVEIATLSKKEFTHSLKVHGVVEASKNILANPEVSGKIISISVKDGQKISKGQSIATIDASILRKNIEEVKKSLEFATIIFKKQKTLNDKGVGTEVQFLEAKNRKESLEKSLETLNSTLAKYVVRAPIGGYVEEVLPKVGEMVTPQFPIARLVNLDKVFIESDISEALLGKVKEGAQVEVYFSNIDMTVQGKIVQTGQYINPQNRTFKIKVDLAEQNSLFKPNLLSIVKITDYKVDSAIVVPTITIQNDMKGDFVFVIEEGKAVKKYVELGQSNTSETEILKGLSANKIIITKGHKGLVEGEKLAVFE